MSLSIKVSQLTVLPQITVDDYIIVNDSGSVTTERASMKTLQDFLSGSNEYVGSASFALNAVSASHANNADNSNSSSYAVSASHANNADLSSYSVFATSASFVVGSTDALQATSASFASSSIFSQFSLASLSSSYASCSTSASNAKSSSFASKAFTSSYASSASLADQTRFVMMNGGVGTGGSASLPPYYPWLAMWSGSNIGKLQRTNISDLGFQYNIGKPVVFLQNLETTPSIDTGPTLTPLGQPYKELIEQGPYGTYGPWLILSYLYSGTQFDDLGNPNPTGSWPGWQNPNLLPPGTNGIDRNLRYIPNYRIPNNILDETSIGSQHYTLYCRSTSNFAWYQGGSFSGHNASELSPGISGSCMMVLANFRLGIGQFGSGSQRDVGTANPTPPIYPLAPLHISASEGAMNNTNTPLVRLDQKVGTAGSIGSLQGWIRVSINGVLYKMPLYN